MELRSLANGVPFLYSDFEFNLNTKNKVFPIPVSVCCLVCLIFRLTPSMGPLENDSIVVAVCLFYSFYKKASMDLFINTKYHRVNFSWYYCIDVNNHWTLKNIISCIEIINKSNSSNKRWVLVVESMK